MGSVQLRAFDAESQLILAICYCSLVFGCLAQRSSVARLGVIFLRLVFSSDELRFEVDSTLELYCDFSSTVHHRTGSNLTSSTVMLRLQATTTMASLRLIASRRFGVIPSLHIFFPACREE